MSAAADPATRPPGAPAERGGDSIFEASAFERSLAGGVPSRWLGWRRRALALAALLGCLAVFVLARTLANGPALPGDWEAGPAGELVLKASPLPALQAHAGQALVAIGGLAGPPIAVDALLLHRWPRWQPDDALRARQLAQHEALARHDAAGPLLLAFQGGEVLSLQTPPRGYEGLGLVFWPLAGLALLLYLFGVVLALARPRWRTGFFVTMAWCQAFNLLLAAAEGVGGLGLPPDVPGMELPLRALLDLCSGAAVVHAFTLHPLRLPRAGAWAMLAWSAPLGFVVITESVPAVPAWWLVQGLCMALAVAALALTGRSHRREPNPYALVMRRLSAAVLAGLVLLTAAVAATATRPGLGLGMAAAAPLVWQLFVCALLLLTPFLARSRQVLREFALLAGVSTVATALDLLFVAMFSLGAFASLAVAVFIGIGLYAGARQWVLARLIGSSMPTTERAFDQIYRAAREVQAHPRRYTALLMQLLRELFDPLETLRVDRVPVRARVVGGGSALVVPVRGAEDDGGTGAPANLAVVLRFAQRGQRLFTLDDARLADRVVDQLRRAVAYDMAVERGRFEERQRIAQDLHDDIGARLLTLMYQAQTREMEDYIRHTLQDLKTLTRGLATAEHPLSHAAAEWKSDITQRLTVAHVALGWNFSHDSDPRLTVVQWSALTRVLRELVSNALYHGHATRVDVTFKLEGPLLTLQVADDGIGRDPPAWAHGLGLGGVRKRVKVLGGEVAWRENGERGIVCAVRVPAFQGRAVGDP
jgi:signal transduction histidine kinase